MTAILHCHSSFTGARQTGIKFSSRHSSLGTKMPAVRACWSHGASRTHVQRYTTPTVIIVSLKQLAGCPYQGPTVHIACSVKPRRAKSQGTRLPRALVSRVPVAQAGRGPRRGGQQRLVDHIRDRLALRQAQQRRQLRLLPSTGLAFTLSSTLHLYPPHAAPGSAAPPALTPARPRVGFLGSILSP